jgi:hypothetical protein
MIFAENLIMVKKCSVASSHLLTDKNKIIGFSQTQKCLIILTYWRQSTPVAVRSKA